MFISVIPLSKTQGRNPYLYIVNALWKNQVVIGWLVEVPFWKDIITALIISVEEALPEDIDTSYIRPIHAVISSTSLIDSEQIVAILAIARRYFLPIHKALALFLPASLLTRLEKRNFILEKASTEQNRLKDQEMRVEHYIHTTFSPKHLEQYMRENSVILFPDDVMLYTFMKWNNAEAWILILPTEATPTKRVQGWIDISEKKYKIIVWTRRLLYYNLSAYKNIVYIEDAFWWEQFQYPISLRSLDVLAALSQSPKHQITIVSSSPTLELFKKFPQAKISPRKA